MMEKSNKKAMLVALGLATELTALVLAGIFGGHYLGGYLGRADLGAIAGCILAFSVWTWRLVKLKRYLL